MQLTAKAPAFAASGAEHALVVRARAGDGDAFVELVRPYDRGLRSLAFRLLADSDAMDDALQAAYVGAFRALPRFREHAAVSTWLYRIAYNACLDELRRGRRRPEPVEEAGELGSPQPDPADAVARRLDLAAALGSLTVDVRAAVLLVDGEGFSYAEAGSILGLREGTVASRLHRGRAALRAALRPTERDEETP